MWATFDYAKYETRSIVKVMFSDEVNDESFDAFLKEWISLYNAKRDFSFVFDTTRVGYVPLKYSIRMSSFIGKLKKCPYQYLQKSVFIVSSNFVQYMLDFIFLIQPPVAPIYMTQEVDEVESLLSANNAID
tara:strand:- start:2312 stop:2704 length:393 start_codon:yes stop_codon:yes gene_type:complete